jgi:hypothetical protein
MVLSLSVQAESGVVITKASAGATFTATLSWRRAAGLPMEGASGAECRRRMNH